VVGAQEAFEVALHMENGGRKREDQGEGRGRGSMCVGGRQRESEDENGRRAGSVFRTGCLFRVVHTAACLCKWMYDAGMQITSDSPSRRDAGDIQARAEERQGKCSKHSPSSFTPSSTHHKPARTLRVFLWDFGLAAGGTKVVASVVSSVMMAGGGISSIALAMAAGGWENVPGRVLCLLREVGRVPGSGQVAGILNGGVASEGYAQHHWNWTQFVIVVDE